MPVAKLYCEGNVGSPDVRVLSRLLNGYTTIQILPDNSKFGMDQRIQIRRETVPGTYCVVDRDFAISWHPPTDKPCEWKNQEGEVLGWTWERKEIENYLLDPVVVRKALGATTPRNYPDLLEEAADLIAPYQAARIALFSGQPTRSWLNPKFGKKRGKHNYPFPESFEDADCQAGITQKVEEYLSRVTPVDKDNIIETYQTLLPKCLTGGERRQDFLHAFAGKDLLWALHEPLMSVGIGGGGPPFLERIVGGIQNTSDDIATWLPEWQALRDMIL